MGDLADEKATATADGANAVLPSARHVESALRVELATEDRALGKVAPILGHLLSGTGQSLVSDSIVAKLRGMLFDLANQLASTALEPHASDRRALADKFTDQLSAESAVLSHCYALAVEGSLTDLIAKRSRIDPVLTPLAQELVASERPDIGELAMHFLAAQARFIQYQTRMHMPLAELPAELFHSVLRRWEDFCEREGVTMRATGIQALKTEFDESSGRVGILARLISAMRGGAIAALDLEHSGFALFVSALSSLTRQPRELAVLAGHERQSARLTLSLRAAGLDEAAIERQFLILQPNQRTPRGVGEIGQRDAQNILTRSDANVAS